MSKQRADLIQIQKNTATTWAITVLDDDGGTFFHMVVNSWEEVVQLIRLAGGPL